MATGKVIDRDRGMKRIMRGISKANGWYTTVGVHGEDAGERGDFEGDLDNVAIAAIHEFGAPKAGIPERSFMRAAFDANVKKYLRILRKGIRKITAGTGTAKQAVALAGEVATSDVVNLINAGIPPENTDATRNAKGSSTPLIATGQMKAAIKPVVKKR